MGDGFRRTGQVLQSSNGWKDAQTSPERTRVWAEPRMKKVVSVVYYLSRNGHLEHPHFMEVPLSSPDGLHLEDVVSRLNLLRGTGMAGMYSWSSKRSYKNGYVWQDLSEDDYIHPVHGLDYVLKGSEILLLSDPTDRIHSDEIINSAVKRSSPDDCQSWMAGADASTQTDDKKRGCRVVSEIEVENQIVELEGSGSPPPVDSSSSPDTLESLMLADKRLMSGPGNTTKDASEGAGCEPQSGRLKASSVLMQLITCGSFSFRDCGATAVKDHGLRLISDYRGGMASDVVAGSGDGQVVTEAIECDHIHRFERVTLEDKEYFSGSVILTKTNEFHNLKRSSSYNADRVYQTKMEQAEKQQQMSSSLREKCVPRKPKSSLVNSTTD